jgi:hypothetical protein
VSVTSKDNFALAKVEKSADETVGLRLAVDIVVNKQMAKIHG